MAEFRDSIEIAATPQTVFAYLTTNEGMTAWMGEYADLNPTPGGQFAVDIAGYPVRGEYLVVEPPRRVVVSWGFAGNDELPAGASTVEFVLTATPTGTRVDLRHFNLPDTAIPGHAYGWANFLPRLQLAGAGHNPGPDHWRPLADITKGTPHMPSLTPYDVVTNYHRAWTTGDIETAMSYVADDITCRAPGVDLEGKQEYQGFIARFAPNLTGIGDIAEFSEGNRVALFYYPQTATTDTAPAAECFTVRDGKIVDSVLIFDRLSYAPPA